ncbi:hypothetical protein Syun_008785 [Stephania yunnanensis]|uniref:Uncharacterized protein n=1 Tax=Stephania yunnanensis TaxID=152371 RepID=A0AAP0PRP0_9MAGN
MFDVGVDWVGSVYRKFETMCQEVCQELDEAVRPHPDTTKYVENSVHNVGASVKKFYDGLMHDLMPPSSTDSVKGDNTKDLSLEKSADFGAYEKKFIEEKTNGHRVLRKTTENNALPSLLEGPKAGFEEDTSKESPSPLDLAEVVTPAEKSSIKAMSLRKIAEKNNSLQQPSLGTVMGKEDPKTLPEKDDGVGIDKLSYVPTSSIKEKRHVQRASGRTGPMTERSQRKIYRKPRVVTEANAAKEKRALSNVNELSATSGKVSSQIFSFTDIYSLSPFSQEPNGSAPCLSLEPNDEAVNCNNSVTVCDPANKVPGIELSNLNSPTLVGAGKSESFPEVPCEMHKEACNVNSSMLSSSEPMTCNFHEEKGIEGNSSLVENIADESGTCTSTTSHTSTFISCPSIELEDDGECADLDAYMASLETEITGRNKNSGEESGDAVKQINEVTEEFHNANLEDSCIVVDNREVAFVFQSPRKHQSYKKKIHDALASRLRSAKKREYEQLAIWCKGIESQEKAKSLSLSSGLDLNTRNSQTYGQQESEWELL